MNSDNIGKVIQMKKELDKIKEIEEKLNFILLNTSNIKVKIIADTDVYGIEINNEELALIDSISELHNFFQNLKKNRKEKVTKIYREIEKL